MRMHSPQPIGANWVTACNLVFVLVFDAMAPSLEGALSATPVTSVYLFAYCAKCAGKAIACTLASLCDIETQTTGTFFQNSTTVSKSVSPAIMPGVGAIRQALSQLCVLVCRLSLDGHHLYANNGSPVTGHIVWHYLVVSCILCVPFFGTLRPNR